MRILVGGLLLTSVQVLPVQAGIHMHFTNAGGTSLTGGRGQTDSYGLGHTLLDSNNILVTADTRPNYGNLTDSYLGVDPQNQHYLGYLTRGFRGTLFTYDKMAYVPVLQLLGFDYDPQAAEDQTDLPSFADEVPLRLGGPVALHSNSASSPPLELTVVPEPGGVVILGALTMLMYRRPRPRP